MTFPFRSSLLALLLSACLNARAADNRLYLAEQYDFGAKTGFYLDFENSTEADSPARLSTLHLILGVGDGKTWRFLNTQPALEYGRDYTATGTISPGHSRLELDGMTIAEGDGDFRPENVPLTLNNSPGWAQAPAEYVIYQRSLTLTVEGRKPLAVDFGSPPPLPVRLFGGTDTRRFEGWRVPPGKTLTVRAVFRIDRRPADLHGLAPFIDRYGQSRHASWPGKVRSDADLKRAAREETRTLKAMPPSPDYDPFGGYRKAGWKGKTSGFYSVTKRGGKWWLISPQGNPTFYTSFDGIPTLTWDSTPITGREYLFTSLPPTTGPTAPAWGENAWGQDPGTKTLAFHSVNMLRKYGPDWRKIATQRTVQRARSWGFSGAGKWSDFLPGMPNLPVLGTSGVPKIARHADVFDPAVKEQFKEVLRKQIAPHAKDPYVVGWSVGNEYDEIITPDEVREILKKDGNVPAKRALSDEAVDHLFGGDVSKAAQAAGLSGTGDRQALYVRPLAFPEETVEALRRFYADRYYDFLYRTVKSLDPNHLYLGFWIAYGWWVNEEDWRLIARHVDVIGYDRYAYTFGDPAFDRLTRESGKPILCGEYAFPPVYHARRGYAFYPSGAEDEADAARYYVRWTRDAAVNPYCVGLGWFQYRDEPLTGRGPGHGADLVYGEHFAFGLVDVTDRPKWELVRPVRQANLAAVRQRLK